MFYVFFTTPYCHFNYYIILYLWKSFRYCWLKRTGYIWIYLFQNHLHDSRENASWQFRILLSNKESVYMCQNHTATLHSQQWDFQPALPKLVHHSRGNTSWQLKMLLSDTVSPVFNNLYMSTAIFPSSVIFQPAIQYWFIYGNMRRVYFQKEMFLSLLSN